MFSGRIDRIGFLYGLLYQIVPMLLIIVAFPVINTVANDSLAFRSVFNIVLYVFGILWIVLFLPLLFGLLVRRCHDFGMTGWLSILYFVPVLNLLTLLFVVFVPGTVGPNRYGEHKTPRKVLDVLIGEKAKPPTKPRPGTFGSGTM